MIVAVLFIAVLQLAVAGRCYADRGQPGSVATSATLFGFAFLLGLCVFLSPISLAQLAILIGIGFILARRKLPTRTFLTASAATTAAIFLAVGLWNVMAWSRAGADYPLVSIADRLRYEDRRAKHVERTSEAEMHGAELSSDQLARLEQMYAPWQYARTRTTSLRLMHATHVEQFIESPGFGVGRNVRPSPEWVRLRERASEPIPQPLVSSLPARSASGTEASPMVLDANVPGITSANGFEFHESALQDFASPDRFGYVRSREQVAGFEPHHFSQLPAPDKSEPRWRTVRVELVSLLKHDRPMVYVSKNLPRMDELRNAPVRPLDAFEQTALAALEHGEEVVSQTHGDRLRMLGAVRAVQQCLDCHQVKRGAMLGAFSYELRSKRPVENPPDEPKLPTEAL